MAPRWIIALCIAILLPNAMCRRTKVKRNAQSYPEKRNWYQTSRQQSWGPGASNDQDSLNSVVQMPGGYGNRIPPAISWQQAGRSSTGFDQRVTQDTGAQTTQSYGQGNQNDNGYGSPTPINFGQEGITDDFGQGVGQTEQGQRPVGNQNTDSYGSNGNEKNNREYDQGVGQGTGNYANGGNGRPASNGPQVPGEYNGSIMRGSEQHGKSLANTGYDQSGIPDFGQQGQRPAPGRYGQRTGSNIGVSEQYGGQTTIGPISGLGQEREEYGGGQNGGQDGNQNIDQGVTQSNQNGGVYRQQGYPVGDNEQGDRNVGGSKQNGNPSTVDQSPENGNDANGYGQVENQGGQMQVAGQGFNGQNDGYGEGGQGRPSWSSNSWQTTLQNGENFGVTGGTNPPSDNFIPSSQQAEQGIWDGGNTNGQLNRGSLSSPNAQNQPGSSWEATNSQMYQAVNLQPKLGTSQAVGIWEPIIMQGRPSEFGNQFTGQGNPPYDSTAKQMAEEGARGYNNFGNKKGSNYVSKNSQNGGYGPQGGGGGGGGGSQMRPSNGAGNNRGRQNNLGSLQGGYNGIKTQQNGDGGERGTYGPQANRNNGNYAPNDGQNGGRNRYGPQNGQGGTVGKGGFMPQPDSNYRPQGTRNGDNERYGPQNGQAPSNNADINGARMPPGQFGQSPQNGRQGNGIATQPGPLRPVPQNGGQDNGLGMPPSPIGQYPQNGEQGNGLGMPPSPFGQYPQNGGQGNGIGMPPGLSGQSPQNGGQGNEIGTQPSPFGQAPQNSGGQRNGIGMPPSPFGQYPQNSGQGNGIQMSPSQFGQAPQNGGQGNGIGRPPSQLGQYPLNDGNENGEGTQYGPSGQIPLNGQGNGDEMSPGTAGSSVPGRPEQDAGRNTYGNVGQTGYKSGRPGQIPINPSIGRPVQPSGRPGQTPGIPSYGRPGKASGDSTPERPRQTTGISRQAPRQGASSRSPGQAPGGSGSAGPMQTTGTPSYGRPGQGTDGPSYGRPGQGTDGPSYGRPGQDTDGPSSGRPGQSPGGSDYDRQAPFDGSNGLRGQSPFGDSGDSGQSPVTTSNMTPGTSVRPQGNFKGGDEGGNLGDDPSQWRLEDSIPGTPGEDYPNLNSIPDTGFDCKQQPNPGYYGDVNAQCQVFHICQADGRSNSFLCPVGTIFNQQYFICDWWFNVNCAETPSYYNLNSNLYDYSANGNFKGDPYPSNGVTQQGDSSPETYPQNTGSGPNVPAPNGGLGDTGYSGETGMAPTPSVPSSGSYPGATGSPGGSYAPVSPNGQIGPNGVKDGQYRGSGPQGGRNAQGTGGYDQNRDYSGQKTSWAGQPPQKPHQSSHKGQQFRPSDQGGSWNGEANQPNLNGGDAPSQGRNTQSPSGDTNQGWTPIDQSSTKSPGRPQDGGQYNTADPQGGNAAQDASWNNMNNNRRGGKGSWNNGDNSYQSSRWQSGGSAATSSAANAYFQQNQSWSINAPSQQRLSWV